MHLKEELPTLLNIVYTDQQIEDTKEKLLDKTAAYGILVRADRDRYGKLIEELKMIS